jgi:hypothetical protein
MEGTTTTLRVQDDTVTMEREGTIIPILYLKRPFFPGQLSTPLGDIQVGMFPTHMDFSFGRQRRWISNTSWICPAKETLNQILVQLQKRERPFA